MSLEWRGEAVLRRIQDLLQDALEAAGEVILDASNSLVPVESGDLKDSGRVASDADEAAVVYDTPYAVHVHEDMTDFHDDGSAKFLERGAASSRGRAADAAAGRLRRSIG